MNNLKIIVTFHKDYMLDQLICQHQDIYVPVFAGSSVNNNTDFLGKMIRDDCGENISNMNRYLSEFTSLYWLKWNIDKIGNPSYVGHNHYRRIFEYDKIQNYQDYDIICYDNIIGYPIVGGNSIYTQFASCHGSTYLDRTIDVYSIFDQDFGLYIKNNKMKDKFYPKVMFVMKKRIFEELYFRVIEPMKYLPAILDVNSMQNKRIPAFIGERLFSYFISYKMDNGAKVKTIPIESKLI